MRKILVVEDDNSVSSLVRALLEAEGYVTVGEAAVAGAWGTLMKDWQAPDAAIIDLHLRDGEGWDLITQMRKDERFAHLPIVVLSGLPEAEVADRAASLGCQYIGKPFSAAALMDRLQTAMRDAGRALAVRPIPVLLLMDAYRLEGQVYVAVDVTRFSDAWEAVIKDAREFIPVTGVKLTSLEGKPLVEMDFAEVRKSDVRAAFPLREPHR